MRLKTPQFWYDKKATPLSLILWPLSILYGLGRHIHANIISKPYISRIPVICVGNVTTGGSGKTPASIALYHLIKQRKTDLKIAFLTRGYGGTIDNVVFVQPQEHSAGEVGDEALLLAAHAPTIKAKNRKEGIQCAEQHDYDLVIMDDGMQNNSITKNFTIMVVDAQKEFGNEKLLPAGPLREPLKCAIKRANLILAIGGELSRKFDKPVISAHIEAQNISEHIPDERYLAFCGLAHPDKFYNTLAASGYEVAKVRSFPDHYRYNEDDLSALNKIAHTSDLRLITTQKDAVKIPQSVIEDANIVVFAIDLKFEDNEMLFDLISKEIAL